MQFAIQGSMRRRAAVFLMAATAAFPLSGCGGSDPARPESEATVFAAASLTDALMEARGSFEAQTDARIHLAFASSSTLARQIVAGAPADLFISANVTWMDHLETEGLIKAATRINLAANQLVLIRAEGEPAERSLSADDHLPSMLSGRLALGDPDHVPAGIYAKEALEHLKWWDDVRGRIATAPDVRAALRLVEMGECEYGIVYRSDAVASERVVIAGVFPSESHDPILYPASLTKDGDSVAAEFLRFLVSEAGIAILEEHGLRRPPDALQSQP